MYDERVTCFSPASLSCPCQGRGKGGGRSPCSLHRDLKRRPFCRPFPLKGHLGDHQHRRHHRRNPGGTDLRQRRGKAHKRQLCFPCLRECDHSRDADDHRRQHRHGADPKKGGGKGDLRDRQKRGKKRLPAGTAASQRLYHGYRKYHARGRRAH